MVKYQTRNWQEQQQPESDCYLVELSGGINMFDWLVEVSATAKEIHPSSPLMIPCRKVIPTGLFLHPTLPPLSCMFISSFNTYVLKEWKLILGLA